MQRTKRNDSKISANMLTVSGVKAFCGASWGAVLMDKKMGLQ